MLSTCLVEFEDPTADLVAVLIATSFLEAEDVPRPEPVAGRRCPLLNCADEDPDPLPTPCLTINRYGSASSDDVADPVADLNSISLSVLAEAPAEPDPDADLTSPRINADDSELEPEAVAAL